MKHNILKWLSEVTEKHKFKVLILAVIQAVLGGSSVLYALLLRNTIDNAAEKNQSGFLFSLGAVVGLVLIQILLRAVVRWLEELSRATIENIFKSRLFDVLLKKTYASVTEVHSGEWQNRLTSDTQVTANGIVEILSGILGMAVKMVGALLMLLVIEPKFMYILIPGGVALILLTYAFRKVLKRLHKSIQEKDGSLRIFLQERLGSLMIVRTFSAETQSRKQAEQKIACLLASISTAVIGPISFLGLIVPHIARLLIGSNHAVLMPYTMILGAFTFLLADTVGRTICYPYEINATVIMAVVGGPFFIFLLRRSDKHNG